MPIVNCVRCDGRYSAKPSAMKVKGFNPLCYKCRCEIPKVNDKEYMCVGKSLNGEDCKLVRMYGKDTCWHHRNQNA